MGRRRKFGIIGGGTGATGGVIIGTPGGGGIASRIGSYTYPGGG